MQSSSLYLICIKLSTWSHHCVIQGLTLQYGKNTLQVKTVYVHTYKEQVATCLLVSVAHKNKSLNDKKNLFGLF